MSSIFFTSDTHFFHSNILKYCSNRKYDTVEDMNEDLIAKWNSVVHPEDTVYHLGDFSFNKDPKKTSNIVKSLNGHKHLIMGNHDVAVSIDKVEGFAYVSHPYQGKIIKVNGITVFLNHFPLSSWPGYNYGSYHFFGHCHGNLKSNLPKSVDVGVDCFGGYPVSFDTIFDATKMQEYLYTEGV